MPTTENSANETPNQAEKSASPANSGSGTANISDTIVQVGATVKAPTPSASCPAIPAFISKGITKDPAQTQPQNANNRSSATQLPLSVMHVAPTTATVTVAPVQASTQPVTSSTTIKSVMSNLPPTVVMITTGLRPISPMAAGPRVSSPTVTMSAQPPVRMSSPLGPAVTRVATATQAPGKAAVIAIPRPTTFQQPAASIRPPQTTSVQLPANFHIPPGMVLIRSDSGQLMLVSQQALAAAQGLAARAPGTGTSPSPRPPTTQVSAATLVRKAENPGVIRVPPPPSPHVTTAQSRPMVKVVGAAPIPPAGQIQIPRPMIRPVAPVTVTRSPGPLIIPTKPTNTPRATPPTITPEVLENVKKCKNFLVTLIKLASSGTHSADMAKNVRELVKSLLDGRLEPEEFTDQLYRELKSSPQPYLVPFLKKSLPAVRQLTPNPQLFIQEVDQPKPQAPATSKASASKAPAPTAGRTPALLSTNSRPAPLSAASGQSIKSTQLVIQQPRGVVYKPAVTNPAPARTYLSVQNRSLVKPMVIQSGQYYNTGAVVRRTPFLVPPPPAQRHAFKDSVGSFREEDDINDVASMAGVNVSEENARILATNSGLVGSVERSCQDKPFLSPALLLTHILHTGKKFGVSEVGSDVVSLVSHATQERLRDLLEKVTVVAQHRKIALKEDYSHVQTSDVRSQLHFLEELERLEKQRRDDEERETLLRVARSRCNTDDPDQQLLKQRAKELQQLEQAQLQHREANLTALAAIGPRRKRPLDSNGNQVGPGGIMSVLQRAGVQRVTGVSLRDLLFCLEQDPPLRHSLTLYKGLLR
uniref:transcription initiation factor TFIID subunit 4 isoform X1 n=1 Tax=Oncorhynchus gorbuscha TaxID=8017 RepID=UPI001EAF7C39|nr:transcription initiation factor TFIID subunit 4 isoform X1 [Oncorhynchus gorbuscha]XP_046156338.1 transcription initiation factor TFIID subunit 4 isoform X1 [Oncorhynchus gorbuscha]